MNAAKLRPNKAARWRRRVLAAAALVALGAGTTFAVSGQFGPGGRPVRLADGLPFPFPPGCSAGGCKPNPTISPVIIDVDGSGYRLTDAGHGVKFDFFGTGHPVRISWTAPGSTNAFLVLPHNGTVANGAELFGDLSPQPASAHPNGFAALAVFDRPDHGGNGDEIIDARDAIWTRLRLWQDPDHDGRVQPGELHTLPALGVTAIDLVYRPVPGADAHGNRYGYAATVTTRRGAAVAYDFFLTTAPAAGNSSLPTSPGRHHPAARGHGDIAVTYPPGHDPRRSTPRQRRRWRAGGTASTAGTVSVTCVLPTLPGPPPRPAAAAAGTALAARRRPLPGWCCRSAARR